MPTVEHISPLNKKWTFEEFERLCPDRDKEKDAAACAAILANYPLCVLLDSSGFWPGCLYSSDHSCYIQTLQFFIYSRIEYKYPRHATTEMLKTVYNVDALRRLVISFTEE